MALSQHKFREAVFQVLFSLGKHHSSEEDIVKLIVEQLSISRSVARSAYQRAMEIINRREELDMKISEISTSYDFDRIQAVEKTVLRLGVYELLFDDTVPAKVVIAEAMRINKKFSTKESMSFINAILDKIAKQL